MIRAKAIPKVLEQIHVDGIEASILMVKDGALMSATGTPLDVNVFDGHVLAAILGNVLADYDKVGPKLQGGGQVRMVTFQCQRGRVGAIRIGKRYVAAACGQDVSDATIREQLNRLHGALEPVLRTLEELEVAPTSSPSW